MLLHFFLLEAGEGRNGNKLRQSAINPINMDASRTNSTNGKLVVVLSFLLHSPSRFHGETKVHLTTNNEDKMT